MRFSRKMGASVSGFFQSKCGHVSGCNEQTKQIILTILKYLSSIKPEEMRWIRIGSYLNLLPKGENILSISEPNCYNLLQWAVGLKCIELVKWILNYGVDVNRVPCSLPLHIAALNGSLEIADLLIKHGAKVEQETRMCFPGPHSHNCEMRRPGLASPMLNARIFKIHSFGDRLQNAKYYAIDGDHAELLNYLIDNSEEICFPWQRKKPLLYKAFEKKAWNCVKFLIASRQEEINKPYDDEYYPIHQAVLHATKFVSILLQFNADVTVRTATQQLTIIHVLLLLGKKSANETTLTLKLLFEHGARELINEPDSLGNTPLHALIVRYALEESRNGVVYNDRQNSLPWTTWDMLHLLRFFLQNGAGPSISRKGNSAIACVLRHVRDWEFRFELLDMLLQHGGDPNCVGSDGSVPLIVCLVPLLNKGLLHLLNHSKKISYLNCIRLLCKYGANPNCSWNTNLTPLHVLVFTAREYISVMDRDNEKDAAFAFFRQVLLILLQHKLDPNVCFSQKYEHVLLALLDLVQNARLPSDLNYVYDLTLTLIQYGASLNRKIENEDSAFFQSNSPLIVRKNFHHVLYYYVQYLIKKEDILLNTAKDSFKYYSKLIWLYFNAMKHKDVYFCLKEVYKDINSCNLRNKCVKYSTLLIDLVKFMSLTPRSLKSLARNTIYYSFNQNFTSNVNKLQLPNPVKEYIVDFNPYDRVYQQFHMFYNQ